MILKILFFIMILCLSFGVLANEDEEEEEVEVETVSTTKPKTNTKAKAEAKPGAFSKAMKAKQANLKKTEMLDEEE